MLSNDVDQKNALLALGNVDLNPSYLNFAELERKLGNPVQRKSGDFDSTRLGWACGKERCAILASFLVPFGHDIPPETVPAGFIIMGPASGDFPNISVRDIHLGESDQKLAALSQASADGNPKPFRRISWDKDWTLAWGSLDGKVFALVFANDTLQHKLTNSPVHSAPVAKQ